MGLDIVIGERDGDRALVVEVPEAPLFDGDSASRTNHRHPSYTDWEVFLRATRLRPLFHDPETGLVRHHPGCLPLRHDHLGALRQALQTYVAHRPGQAAGFFSDQDAHLARLIWFVWWTEWALKTCGAPVIANW